MKIEMIYVLLITLSLFIGMASSKSNLHLIAHRGASYYLPEETGPAFTLAAKHGVNFVECDIVSTKDGILILRHSPNLSESTNVDDLPEFSRYRKTEILYNSNDSEEITGIFSWDLTFEEIKKIRCTHEKRFNNRNQELNGIYHILTLEEFLDMNKEGFEGYFPGLYIEIKYPSMHQQKGIYNITDKLLSTLERYGLNKKTDNIFIQSFEPKNLEYIRNKSDLNLVQLLTRDNKNSFVYALEDPESASGMKYAPCNLEYVSKFANVVSPYKEDLISPLNQSNFEYAVGISNLPKSSYFISRSHELGLLVIPYTFRPESILPFFNSIFEEYDYFIKTLLTDGVFADDSKSLVDYLREKSSDVLLGS